MRLVTIRKIIFVIFILCGLLKAIYPGSVFSQSAEEEVKTVVRSMLKSAESSHEDYMQYFSRDFLTFTELT